MASVRRLLVLLVVGTISLTLSACLDKDNSPETSAEDTTVVAVDTTVTQPEVTTPVPPVVTKYETFIGDWKMNPGRESTRCVIKRLDNTEPIWVSAIETELARGSHHLIVYRSNATEELLTPEPCTPFVDVVDGTAYPLMITQIASERLQLPDGVALKLEPHQMIRIEAHYLNYFDQPITAHADVTFEAIPQDTVVHEAGLMLYGTPDIRVPPKQTVSTPWFYLPIWEGVNIFAATGHTHQHGTNVELYKSGPSDPFGVAEMPDDGAEPIYPLDETFIWDESPVLFYDPPLAFGADQGIRYQCTWENTSNSTVTFGESANQEMCFFWLYYYPSNDYRLCINLGSWYEYAPGLLQPIECCPDSAVCAVVTGYLNGDFNL